MVGTGPNGHFEYDGVRISRLFAALVLGLALGMVLALLLAIGRGEPSALHPDFGDPIAYVYNGMQFKGSVPEERGCGTAAQVLHETWVGADGASVETLRVSGEPYAFLAAWYHPGTHPGQPPDALFFAAYKDARISGIWSPVEPGPDGVPTPCAFLVDHLHAEGLR